MKGIFRSKLCFFLTHIIILLICLSQLSCSYGDYLTGSKVRSFGERIKGIQVYINTKKGAYMARLTGEAPLYRQITQNTINEKNVAEGKAKEKELINIKEKEIEIDWGTPGVIVDYSDSWVKVDFGGGIILKFSLGNDGIYFLSQKEIIVDRITYQNVRWSNSEWCILEFDYDKDIDKEKEYEYKKAPGKEIK